MLTSTPPSIMVWIALVEAQLREDPGPVLPEQMGDLRDAGGERQHAGRTRAAVAADFGIVVGYHEAVADALRVGQEEVIPAAGVGLDACDPGVGEEPLPLRGRS